MKYWCRNKNIYILPGGGIEGGAIVGGASDPDLGSSRKIIYVTRFTALESYNMKLTFYNNTGFAFNNISIFIHF